MKLSALILIAFSEAFGQTNEEIMTPIRLLFKGMEEGDSAMVHSAFYKEVTLNTILTDINGKPSIKSETSLQGFLNAIGTPHKEAWREPIWNTQIQVDGVLAQVWASYAFYLGKKLNHCGIDTFQLTKTDAGWKIFYLADTRQKENCHVPKEIADFYSK